MQEKTFVGRDAEIKRVEYAVSIPASRRIFFVNGEGGIGKTRFLQEIKSRYYSFRQFANVPLVVSDLVDLANLGVYVPLNIEYAVCKNFGIHNFEKFMVARDDYAKFQTMHASVETLNQQLRICYETFVEEYNSFSSENRCVLLIDTVDIHIIESDSFVNFTQKILPQLQNSVIILAGRECISVQKRLKTLLDSDMIQLEGLKTTDAKSFFNQLGLSADLEEKLIFLTDGRPILLGLASAWMEKDIPLPVISEATLVELKSFSNEKLIALKEEFKHALIENILKLDQKDHPFILEMAHLQKRYTPEILAFIHEVSAEEAEMIVTRLSNLFFVKMLPDFVHLLHDEMRDLVRQYLWPTVDPFGVERKNLSQKVQEFYLNKILYIDSQLEKMIKEIDYSREVSDHISLLSKARTFSDIQRYKLVLASERLFYLLEQNPDQGASDLARELEKSIKQSTRDFSSILVNLAETYANKFNVDSYYKVNFQVARWKRSIGEFRDAQTILERLGEHYADNSQKQVSILQTLAITQGDLGQTRDALENLKEALRICETQKILGTIPQIKSNEGMILVSMGKIAEGVDAYNECILRCEELAIDDLAASAMNNIGYAYSILGDHESALSFCESALGRRELLGDTQAIAASHATLGSVYRDMSDFDLANLHYQHALDHFTAMDDKFWISRIRMERGLSKLLEYEEKFYRSTHRSATTVNMLRSLLDESENDIKESIALGKSYNRKELSKAIHEMGHVYWEREDLNGAEKIWKESLEVAFETNNLRYILENLVGFCELDLDRHLYSKVLNHRNALTPYFEETKESHALLWSRLAKMEGIAAFHNGDFDTAFQKFGYSFPTLAKHGGWGRYKITIELESIAGIIDSLDSIEALKWCEFLKAEWNATTVVVPDRYKRALNMFISDREIKAKRRQKPASLN
ncbi:MAG: ATP-binding protein [Bacteroidales bacterium]|nr:ATP-binding protein [Bacteroidales bacterium]